MIAKVAFKMFLGISADITSWNADSTAFSLLLYENPLSGAWFAKGFLKALLTPQSSAECVELPPQHSQLLYSNVLCGVIRGALEMVRKRARARATYRPSLSLTLARGRGQVQLRVECRFVRDVLRGDDVNEIRCVRALLLAGARLPTRALRLQSRPVQHRAQGGPRRRNVQRICGVVIVRVAWVKIVQSLLGSLVRIVTRVTVQLVDVDAAEGATSNARAGVHTSSVPN